MSAIWSIITLVWKTSLLSMKDIFFSITFQNAARPISMQVNSGNHCSKYACRLKAQTVLRRSLHAGTGGTLDTLFIS